MNYIFPSTFIVRGGGDGVGVCGVINYNDYGLC